VSQPAVVPLPGPPRQPSVSLEQLRLSAARRLRATGRVDPREANHLLARLLDLSEAQVLCAGERPVVASLASKFFELVERRIAGEPFAYLVASREFYGRSFAVDRRVLIPRPETEHLVEATLALDLPATARCLDIGTGTGCLAITLALERPLWRLVATECSLDALRVATANRQRFELEGRVTLVAGDLFGGVRPETVAVVVSNPPYVDELQREHLQPEVREWEPACALYATERGLGVYRRLLEAALALRAGSYVALELGDGLLDAVSELAAPGFAIRTVIADYAGIARVVVLERR
jgi:release factor glutamine methyltransferase